jgi:hypothetical protein
MLVNGIGLIMTTFILFTVIILKFREGGWITLVITGLLATFAVIIKKHYNFIRKEIIGIHKEIRKVLPSIIRRMRTTVSAQPRVSIKRAQPAHTAVFLVNGYNGLGLYSFYRLIDSFNSTYTNIVFLHIGIVDSQCFSDQNHYERMKEGVVTDLQKYKYVAEQVGLTADCFYSLGTDVVEEVDHLVPGILAKYPGAVFFGGQFIFNGNSRLNRLLHNYTIFAIQRKLFAHGITTIVIPVPLDKKAIRALYDKREDYTFNYNMQWKS